MNGRTENSIKNYFYATVRKNIRNANKTLNLRKEIKASVKESIANPEISELIMCNAFESNKIINKVIEDQNCDKRFKIEDIPEPKGFVDFIQNDEAVALEEYYQTFITALCWANQIYYI